MVGCDDDDTDEASEEVFTDADDLSGWRESVNDGDRGPRWSAETIVTAHGIYAPGPDPRRSA